MQPMYYIGLDVHKRKISYCVKDASGLGAAPKQMVGAVTGQIKNFFARLTGGASGN